MCKIYTRSELERLSDQELCALFNKLCDELYVEPEGSKRQQAVHTSLDNLRRVIAQRKARLKPPGF